MVILDVMQRTIRPALEAMAMALGKRKGKGFWSFVLL